MTSLLPTASIKKIFVYPTPTPMNFGFPRLLSIIESDLKQDIRDGNMFFFINKKANYIKILFWSNGGCVMVAKKLEAARFSQKHLDSKTLSLVQLTQLVNKVLTN